MVEGPQNPVSRLAAAAIAVVAAVWFCYAGVRHAVASHYATSANPDEWERATHVEPNNAELWYRLGRYRQLDFDHADVPLSITYYQRAVQLNPRSPYYKLDLAGALEMAGKNDEADTYFHAAQAAYPISAEVAWKYGNFLLRQDRLTEAYAEIHRAVMTDPQLIPLAVSRVWHSEPDIKLLDQVLPNTADAYSQALTFLAGAQDATVGMQVWDRLIAINPHTDAKLAFPLIDLLLARDKFDDAGKVWQQATANDVASGAGYAANSLIYNGGFEKDVYGGGFGWRQSDAEGVDFDYDTDEKHSGSRSARLIFDGTKNLSYEGLFQYVLVSPNTHYRFQGYLRTNQISTDNGVRFEIVDPRNQQHLDLLSPNETGTNPWTLEQLDFTTGPGTHLIAVRVTRRPSERLDNKIRGTLWIDDVTLEQAGPGHPLLGTAGK